MSSPNKGGSYVRDGKKLTLESRTLSRREHAEKVAAEEQKQAAADQKAEAGKGKGK